MVRHSLVQEIINAYDHYENRLRKDEIAGPQAGEDSKDGENT